jgi:hypothetical protein
MDSLEGLLYDHLLVTIADDLPADTLEFKQLKAAIGIETALPALDCDSEVVWIGHGSSDSQ